MSIYTIENPPSRHSDGAHSNPVNDDDRQQLIDSDEKRSSWHEKLRPLGRRSTKLLIIICLLALSIITLALIIWIGISTQLGVQCKGDAPDDRRHEPREVVHCKVAVIGSGFAGAFAAYKLAPIYKDKLCVVEKLERDGGRVWDVFEEVASGPVFGVGALRVTENQPTMLALAKELNMTLQLAESDNELLKVRGRRFFRDISGNASESNRMCHTVFHNLTCESGNETETDKNLLAELMRIHREHPERAAEHPDFQTFLISLFGDEGLAFLRESVRYNSPFTSVSTQSILDFFENELAGMGLDPDRYYPAGGMSEYIKRMMASATANGAQIFRGEPVEHIHTDDLVRESKFYLTTPVYRLIADSVLSSIDPRSMMEVNGNVARRVRNAPQFKAILPKALSIVTAWWNERWWERSRWHENVTLSRVVSHQNCFNTMDIPTFPYGRDQNVTRAVYDDGACVDTWRELISSDNKDLLKKTVRDSLQNVFDDITVPTARNLHGFVWENAWHFQVPGSTITNKQIFEWSLRPFPSRNFALIGEAYNLNFAAWCDGALKSTMTVLTNDYNFTFPCLNDPGSPAKCPTTGRPKVGMHASINDLMP